MNIRPGAVLPPRAHMYLARKESFFRRVGIIGYHTKRRSMNMSLVPYVVEQTNRGERSYDIFSRLLNDRIIMLSEEVNATTASLVVAQMLYLEAQDRKSVV